MFVQFVTLYNESTYICSHCNQLFCKECLENNDNHKMIKMINIKEMENKTEKKKGFFEFH